MLQNLTGTAASVMHGELKFEHAFRDGFSFFTHFFIDIQTYVSSHHFDALHSYRIEPQISGPVTFVRYAIKLKSVDTSLRGGSIK